MDKNTSASWSKWFVEQSTWSGLEIFELIMHAQWQVFENLSEKSHFCSSFSFHMSHFCYFFSYLQVRQVWMQKWMGKLHCEPLSTFWWLHWFPHSLDLSWFWWCILATPKPNPYWEVEILKNGKWISWIISWIWAEICFQTTFSWLLSRRYTNHTKTFKDPF